MISRAVAPGWVQFLREEKTFLYTPDPFETGVRLDRLHESGNDEPMNAPPQCHIPFTTTGSYPVRAGNAVRPLIDGEPAFRRICEAIEGARHSVWVTVAFIRPGFRMPQRRGSLFDVLDRAVERGLDARVIFWRPNLDATQVGEGSTFAGSKADHAALRARGSRLRIRWDRAHGGYCQHQKSWLIDAGQPSETAFVGGINLNPRAMAFPGHAGGGDIHDLYVEIAGPSASDVHHNFVQRWNEASERAADDGVWAHTGDDALGFPDRLSAAKGKSLVQLQRNVHPGRYCNGRASPGVRPFDIAQGERAIYDQYLAAIAAARCSIYIENQAITVEPIIVGIADALERGVQVVILVPADPEDWVRRARQSVEYQEFFAKFASLARYDHFALVGIAARQAAGPRNNVYVHGKAMLIDDAWATIGSCNLHRHSLGGNTELNVSFWDPEQVRGLRCELLREHIDKDTSHLDDRAALRLYGLVARENRSRRDAGDGAWQGLAFSLDPAEYGA
jgi:phosphatidylserine/phosphatidylglycerophosphate/cardiolipin synthase-like enzyme